MSRILVADDEMLQREVIRAMLEREGHDVVVVAGGRDGLARLRAEPFDLLVTDVLMPEGDGMSLLVAMRDLGLGIPVIGVTGGADGMTHPYANVMHSLGVEEVLAKPFSAAELAHSVMRALESTSH